MMSTEYFSSTFSLLNLVCFPVSTRNTRSVPWCYIYLIVQFVPKSCFFFLRCQILFNNWRWVLLTSIYLSFKMSLLHFLDCYRLHTKVLKKTFQFHPVHPFHNINMNQSWNKSSKRRRLSNIHWYIYIPWLSVMWMSNII